MGVILTMKRVIMGHCGGQYGSVRLSGTQLGGQGYSVEVSGGQHGSMGHSGAQWDLVGFGAQCT